MKQWANVILSNLFQFAAIKSRINQKIIPRYKIAVVVVGESGNNTQTAVVVGEKKISRYTYRVTDPN